MLCLSATYLYICSKSSVIMKNPYNYLQVRCAESGISLNELCRRAGVNRMGIQRWRKQPPAAFETMAKLESALKEIAAEKQGA